MKIEKIEKSKHKQERILVYLEGGDLLRITQSELLHFGLYAGLDIDGETVVELQRLGKRSETRVRAANMVSARPLSRKELSRKLYDKGASSEDAEAAADWLEEIGALDDAAYAAMLVRHYSAMGYGEGKLREELYRRGVPRELWGGAIAEAPEAQSILTKVIAQKTKGKALDEKNRRKLCDLLLRRGFLWRDVKAAMNRLGETIEDGED
ncbi:MAG: regulatory protein RecX [Eubacteriales bacterium]|nr:regulatory protein RecX [Eubacteriales bacterium]